MAKTHFIKLNSISPASKEADTVVFVDASTITHIFAASQKERNQRPETNALLGLSNGMLLGVSQAPATIIDYINDPSSL